MASVLFPGQEPAATLEAPPPYFPDLNLDQVVESVTAGRGEYELEPFFQTPLASTDAVAYRHEVFRDLEDGELRASLDAFAGGMKEMRERLAQADELRHALQKQRWFLDAVRTYCDTVARFAAELERLELRSRALRGFRDHLTGYVGSEAFKSLEAQTAELEEQLAAVEYTVHIRGARVTVRRYEGEPDYSREVEETFERFRQGAASDYRVRLPSLREMDHVEASVLRGVAELHPDVFGALARYCERHRDYLDGTIRTFDREVQFYVAYLKHVSLLQGAGLRFCLPGVSAESKEVSAEDTFDLALADKLVGEGARVVCNDFHLTDPERIFVVSGPNQGGKTTFARTFGQLHHLASLGCPVPGTQAQLFLFDSLFTHFEREEDIGDLRGKLDADLQRIHDILERATPSSVVIMNESFSSTTLGDARFLGTRVLEQLIDLDLLCVCVTFVDELASLSETTVSMVSGIVPGDPSLRTYKIERRPADGLAYAAVIADKYGLTYEALKERVGR
jgi:DNA mismatch repair protein MutS